MADQRAKPSPSRREFYSYADSTAFHQWHAQRTAEVNARFFLPYLRPGMHLVDCGCGTGSITVGLAEAVAPGEVTGIEISASDVDLARGRAKEEGHTHLRFEVADVYELPLPDESVDGAFFHAIFGHLNDPVRALREAHRVLKPGGVIGVRQLEHSADIITGPFAEPIGQQILGTLVGDIQFGRDPHVGLHLSTLVLEAGFGRVEQTASYECFSTRESIKGIADMLSERFSQPEFVDRVVNRGLTDRRSVEEMLANLKVWREHPASSRASAWCEAVGWKE